MKDLGFASAFFRMGQSAQRCFLSSLTLNSRSTGLLQDTAWGRFRLYDGGSRHQFDGSSPKHKVKAPGIGAGRRNMFMHHSR